MTVALRIFLLAGAVLVLAFVVLKLKKAEFEVTDSLFWLVAVALLAVMALFPQWVYALSELLGFESPSNCVFLLVIAALTMRIFTLNARLAHLRTKVNSLIQEIALREKE